MSCRVWHSILLSLDDWKAAFTFQSYDSTEQKLFEIGIDAVTYVLIYMYS